MERLTCILLQDTQEILMNSHEFLCLQHWCDICNIGGIKEDLEMDEGEGKGQIKGRRGGRREEGKDREEEGGSRGEKERDSGGKPESLTPLAQPSLSPCSPTFWQDEGVSSLSNNVSGRLLSCFQPSMILMKNSYKNT